MRKLIKIFILVLIAINFFYCVSGVIHYPLISVDAVSIWLLKAKIFYLNGVFPLNQINGLKYGHPQYPILLPLIISFIYKLMGGVNEVGTMLLIYPTTYLLILWLCFMTLRKLDIDETWSLVFTYIYSMFSPLLAMGGRMHTGEADIFIVLGYWLVILIYLNFIKNKKTEWLWVIVLVVVFASNIKMEGVFLALVFFFLPINKTKKLLFFTLSIIPLLLWIFIRTKAGIVSDLSYFFPGFIELIKRVLLVLFFSLKEMLKIQNWYIFWPIFVIVLFFARKTKKTDFSGIYLSLAVIFALYTANYTFSTLSLERYVPSSIDRILLQLSPFFFPIFAYKTEKIVAKINI